MSAEAVSSTQILLTWASVPEPDQNGLILGYKVRAQVTFPACLPGPRAHVACASLALACFLDFTPLLSSPSSPSGVRVAPPSSRRPSQGALSPCPPPKMGGMAVAPSSRRWLILYNAKDVSRGPYTRVCTCHRHPCPSWALASVSRLGHLPASLGDLSGPALCAFTQALKTPLFCAVRSPSSRADLPGFDREASRVMCCGLSLGRPSTPSRSEGAHV